MTNPKSDGGSREWPFLKKVIWNVVTGENLNSGYVNAYDLTDKLYAALMGEATKSVPSLQALHNSGERMPNGDTALGGADTAQAPKAGADKAVTWQFWSDYCDRWYDLAEADAVRAKEKGKTIRCIQKPQPSPLTDGERLHEQYDGNGRDRSKGGFCS
jgi:hypothetical protein